MHTDPEDPVRTAKPPVWLVASLISGLALTTCLAFLLGLSYRREARLFRSLTTARQEAVTARRTREDALRRLKSQAALRESLQERTQQQGEALSALRAADKKTQQRYRHSEKELGALVRESQDKSEELIRRHHRIRELQKEVEKLTEQRDAALNVSVERERRIRNEYEAELRTERTRREELERHLSALDEIRALRGRLRRLVDALEQAVESE
jgi:hypothetical protein